ncbi:MAG: hypothetical protein HY551_07440 [Elusimicrobia bacterium]|nr:hypothetical protein [Elusimicrobiota bacterium]
MRPFRAALAATAALVWLSAGASAQRDDSVVSRGTLGSAEKTDRDLGLLQPDIELVDLPTAGVLDYGGYSARTRFYSNGGVVGWANFGIFQRLNIGTSLNVDKLIGTGTPVQITRPDLQVKFRFYDGDRVIPAFAIGFDGQGYLYNRQDLKYNQRQRGLYVIGSQEIGLPGLQAHGGANISDFNSNAIFGAMGLSVNIEDRVLLMAEWDNIQNYVDSRFNSGIRFYISPAFHLDFAVRGIGQSGDYPNGVSRGPERVAMFKYTGNF